MTAPAPDVTTVKSADLCRAGDCDRRPAAGQTLCGRHYAALAYAVAECLEAWRWLGDHTAGRAAGNHAPRVSGSREQPLPITPDLVEHAALIRSTVDWWARQVAQATRTAGPFAVGVGAERTPHGPSQPLDMVCRWLVLRLPWVARQDSAAVMLAELRDLTGRAWQLAPRRGRPWSRLPLPCPRCGRLALAYFADTRIVECRMRDCPEEMTLASYRQCTVAAVAAVSAAESDAIRGPVVAA